MSQDLLDRARAVVEAARKRGAQGARASVTRSLSGTVEWRDGKVDRLRESTNLSLSVVLYVDGRYSANDTSDLRPEAIEAFLDETVAATRVLAVDPHRQLADEARYANRFEGDLRIFDPAAAAEGRATRRRELAIAVERAARGAEGGSEIISVTATAGDVSSESALVCSNGMAGTTRSTEFHIVAGTSVKDADNRRPYGWHYGARCHLRDLPAPERVGAESTRRALAQRGAKPEKSGKYACVVESWVVGRMLRDLLGPLGGQAIQQKRSFLADKMGQRIGSKALDISDDPLLEGGLGSQSYDGEGMATVKRPIFERGVLRTFFLDTYYASKLGQPATTSGYSNLVFGKGKRDLDGLLAAMGKGILVTGFSGGNANSATGDFSVGVRGHLVERGKLVRPITEMNLSGNHLDIWQRLLEVGNDPVPDSSMRTPSLRFDKLQFSGV